jgi:hypothetical protein
MQFISKNEEKYQVYIVNLSSIHKLKSILQVLNQFADLHYRYAPSRLGRWKLYSLIWTALQYRDIIPSINEYKLGKINTVDFIKKLQTIFSFLPAQESDKLLTGAWNSLILWDEQSTERLKALLNEHKPIYFISNTNPLNIEKIIEFFNENYPDITWQLPEVTAEKPLEIADNFYLCPSYQFKEFKEGTPGLIAILKKYLLDNKGGKLENMLLVSQYKADLNKAKELGIESQSADVFFPNVPISNPTSSQARLNNMGMSPSSSATTAPTPILTNNLLNVSRSIFASVSQPHEESSTTPDSEKTPLLRHGK